VLILMLALGCAPKIVDGPVEPVVDPAMQPILPAMEADVYASGHSLPRDVLVAQVALGFGWDESLSGAAAALGLGDVEVSLERAHHAAHRSGFPYPVRVVSSGRVVAGSHPDALLRTLHSVMRKKDRLGLARVRKGESDRWVALIASPVDELRAISREQKLDAALEIRTVGPSTWMLVSPSGQIQAGSTPSNPTLDEEGEWWLEVDGVEQTIAALPLYVNMSPPKDVLIDLPGRTFAGPVVAADEALLLISDVREAFSMARLRDDGTLQTLAQYPLELLLAQQWERDSAHGRLHAAGFTGGPVGQVQCQGPTVAACIDTMVRSSRERELVLNPSFRIGGAAAQVSTDGVTIVVNMASE
jgi:hypothetical protein